MRKVRGLTDDVELHKVTHLGFGADLALVDTGVARLHVLHLQYGDGSLIILTLRRLTHINRFVEAELCVPAASTCP